MKSDRWYNSAIGQKPFPISPPPSQPLLLFSFSLSPFFIILIFPYFYPSLFSLFLFLSAPSRTGTDADISALCGSGRVNPRHLCFKAEGRRQEGASTTFFFSSSSFFFSFIHYHFSLHLSHLCFLCGLFLIPFFVTHVCLICDQIL